MVLMKYKTAANNRVECVQQEKHNFYKGALIRDRENEKSMESSNKRKNVL